MKWFRTTVVLVILAFPSLISGCGDYESRAEIATQRCEDLMSTYCTRIEGCSYFTSHAQCVSEFRQELDCGQAVDTSDSYDRCIDQIEEAHCSAVDELPASCEGVILVRD